MRTPVLIAATAVTAAVMLAQLTDARQVAFRRQIGAVYDVDFEGKLSGPAPRRALAGT